MAAVSWQLTLTITRSTTGAMARIGVGLSAWQWAAWSADIFGAFIFAIVVIGSHTPMTGSWNQEARTMVLSFGTMFWRARSSGWLA